MAIHVVKNGDTLWAISQVYNVPVSTIVAINGLSNVSVIVPGLALYIPSRELQQRTYRIQPGDTLWKLSIRFNSTIASILQANPDLNPNRLLVGRLVTIPTELKQDIATLGFTVPYSQEAVIQILDSLAPQLTYLAVTAYSFTREGYAYVQLEDRRIVERSNQLGVLPLLMIRNLIDSTFSPELAGTVLGNPSYRRNLVLSIVNLARQRGYKGVSIDFEFIPPERRNDFATFLSELKTALGNLLLHVNVHAKTRDIPANPIIGAYDYQMIGKIADIVAVMTIDYGYPGGPPDPISPAWWIEQVVSYAVSLIPPQKLQIAMPLYGYDKVAATNQTTGTSVLAAQNLATSKRVAIQYAPESESPFYRYWTNNAEHAVWFEDVRSYKAKYKIIDTYRLLGTTYWQLNLPAPQNWRYLADNLIIKKAVI
jgi:spore germination protein